jgi:tubulin delta
LGSYLTELLKDEYSKSFLFNTVVWPHETGEVTVQDFNTILSLSSLLPASDGILVFENDILATICKSILNEKRSTLQSMNSIISHTLVSTLLPCDRLIRPDPFTSQKMRPISDPISHLCTHPGYKFVTARDIPLLPKASIEFSYHTWPGLIKHLHQMVIADSFMEERINWRINLHNPKSNSINKSLSTLLILRGKELHEADVSPFSHPAMYAANAYDPFMMAFSKLPVHNYDKCATVITNSQSIIRPLDYKLKRAFDMFSAGAYTHQYYERGIEPSDFVEAFVKLEQVLKNYKSLSG